MARKHCVCLPLLKKQKIALNLVAQFIRTRSLSDIQTLSFGSSYISVKIWRRLLNIVPAEIPVNVLIGCLYIGMRDYIYSPRDYVYIPQNQLNKYILSLGISLTKSP